MLPVPTYPQALQQWQGLFSTLGEASATLIGLLFVAASVGSGVYTAENEHGYRAFLSPTVVHFSLVLFSSLTALAPLPSAAASGAALAGLACFGLAYVASVWHRMHRHGFFAIIDGEDRVWYALGPAAAYALLAAAAVLAWRASATFPVTLAAALALLLLTGLRNAWDMTMWAVTRRTAMRPRETEPHDT